MAAIANSRLRRMVTYGSSQWNDSRRTSFFTIGTIGCFGNVTLMVAEAWLTKLARTVNVSIFRVVIAERISIVFAKQSELRGRISGRRISWLLTNES